MSACIVCHSISYHSLRPIESYVKHNRSTTHTSIYCHLFIDQSPPPLFTLPYIHRFNHPLTHLPIQLRRLHRLTLPPRSKHNFHSILFHSNHSKFFSLFSNKSNKNHLITFFTVSTHSIRPNHQPKTSKNPSSTFNFSKFHQQNQIKSNRIKATHNIIMLFFFPSCSAFQPRDIIILFVLPFLCALHYILSDSLPFKFRMMLTFLPPVCLTKLLIFRNAEPQVKSIF